MNPIRVAIVDDHPFFRQGVHLYLAGLADFEVVAEASTGEEALNSLASGQIDVVLMDLRMPGLDGIETTRQLVKSDPGLKVLLLTSFNDGDKVQKAIEAGAAGYCLKDAPPDELAAALRAVAAGGTYLGKGVSPFFSPADPSPFPELTARELEVLHLMALGKGNREIAAELVVSEKTVKSHVANILQKLGVKTRTQAAIAAHKRGIGVEEA